MGPYYQAFPEGGSLTIYEDDPARTRDTLITALEAASLNPDIPRFHPGILQT